jgi:hypothetical protein
VTVGTTITQADFAGLMSGFQSWFKFECQPRYVVTWEARLLARWHETGELIPTVGIPEWQGWLDSAAERDRAGKIMQRVRVTADPPTNYQKLLIAIDHWHGDVGDHITYIGRGHAERIGLPLGPDWHLFDGAKVVVTTFTPAGEIASRELFTEDTIVRRYRRLRNLALQHASPAAVLAAA